MGLIEAQTVPATEATPTMRAIAWLRSFEDALVRTDVAAAAALFVETCFWRDLIAFTWNISTLEGRSGIAAMPLTVLPGINPHHFEIDGEATEEAGVTSSWFTFETAAGRGKGLVRLRDGGFWTLLTKLHELRGFEEKTGATREKGTEHGAARNRLSWLERKQRDESELGYTRQPYCVIVGGGQGGIALGARMKRLGVPAIIIDKNERPGDAWRNGTGRCVCTTRFGTITCRTCRFPSIGPSLLPKIKSPIGSRCTPRSWSSTTGRPASASVRATTRDAGS